MSLVKLVKWSYKNKIKSKGYEGYIMKKTKIVLVGASGYGAYYRMLLSDYVPQERFDLVGIVDPFPVSDEKKPQNEKPVPFFDTLEEFYQTNGADLAVISSPIRFHLEQCLTAMKNGSHVLCEKPLVPTVDEALALQKASEEYGKLLGVGFQWSFCTPILSLKRDILAGVLGKPLRFSTFISWKRYDAYYLSSSWKGRIHDKDGSIIYDSVATNATAHYLHNIFFLMGDAISASRLPSEVTASLYRAKEIESFDTCFAKGRFDNGAEFCYIATHSGDIGAEPKFSYEFENAVVTMEDEDNPHIVATFKNGETRDYGCPQTDESSSEKIIRMLDAIQSGDPIPCGVSAILPHLAVCNEMFRRIPIYNFDSSLCFREDNRGTFVRGLTEDCFRCYHAGKLPGELNLPWAGKETTIHPSIGPQR